VLGDADLPDESLHSRLYSDLGSDSGAIEGLSHYRAVYAPEESTRKVFTLIEGARITGPGEPNTTYTVSTNVSLQDRSFTYTRTVTTGSTGVYTVTVPYPGEYSVDGESIRVSEPAIHEGLVRHRFDSEAELYWAFDAESGTTAYDTAGGHHGTISNGSWVAGVNGTALRFDPEQKTQVTTSARPNSTDSFTVSAWIKPRTNRSGAIFSTGKDGGSNSHYGILFDHGLSGWNDDRLGLYLGNGNKSVHATSGDLGFSYPVERYHHVAVAFDSGTVRWYLDGKQVNEKSVDAQRVVHDENRQTYIGREYGGIGGINRFDGSIDEVRYYEESLSDEAIQRLFERHSAGGNHSDI